MDHAACSLSQQRQGMLSHPPTTRAESAGTQRSVIPQERRLQTYPGGFLRTVASNAVVTTHVLHVGVNYLPAARLRSDLEQLMPRTTEDGAKVVYVVPSFAPHWDVNAATIPISKRALAEHLRHGRVSQVLSHTFSGDRVALGRSSSSSCAGSWQRVSRIQ
jgi:hypothetical protein